MRREVREEVGIELDCIDYFGSQPWPFPHGTRTPAWTVRASMSLVLERIGGMLVICVSTWIPTSAATPMMPRARVDRTIGHWTTFDAGRGCPFQCSFCTIINVQGRKSRYRTPDDVEAIARANAAQGVTRFFVTDDNYARNRFPPAADHYQAYVELDDRSPQVL